MIHSTFEVHASHVRYRALVFGDWQRIEQGILNGADVVWSPPWREDRMPVGWVVAVERMDEPWVAIRLWLPTGFEEGYILRHYWSTEGLSHWEVAEGPPGTRCVLERA